MKVIKAKVKDYKCLTDIEFTADGRNVLLVGDNEVGKSSLINFIQIACGDQTHIPPDAFGSGHVIVEKDGTRYTLKVKIVDGKSTITVVPEGETKGDDRRSAIASLCGATSFDFEHFVNLSTTKAGQKQQVVEYKKFLPKEFVTFLETEEKRIKDWESERADLGRDVTKLKGSVEKNPLLGANLNDMPYVDIAGVYEELKVAQKHNETYVRGEESLVETSDDITELQEEIKKLKEQLIAANEKHEKTALWLLANPKKDVSEMEKQIADATEINTKFEAAKSLKSDMLKLEGQQSEYGEYTAKIETGRQLIADAIRDEKLPIDGLTFDEDKLIYNGIPVHPDSLSESQQMLLGIRLKFLENPTFGILFIQRTESFGKKRWENVLGLCKEHNFQLIGEKVDSTKDKLTIEIMEE